jgi:hypothetical protein
VWAEHRRLAALTHQARRDAAAKVAAGIDNPGVTIGRQPPLRRVATDPRTGRDVDPFHGAAVITPQLTEFWTNQRDVVGPSVQAQYRQAAERTPFSEAAVAAARQHVGVCRMRRTMTTEGGADVEAAVARYEQSYVNLRQQALDAQTISGDAETRLMSLRRIEADALYGDDGNERGFLAAAVSTLSEVGLVDPDTLTPLAVEPAGK